MILKDEGLVVYVKTIKENHLFIKILSKKMVCAWEQCMVVIQRKIKIFTN